MKILIGKQKYILNNHTSATNENSNTPSCPRCVNSRRSWRITYRFAQTLAYTFSGNASCAYRQIGFDFAVVEL